MKSTQNLSKFIVILLLASACNDSNEPSKPAPTKDFQPTSISPADAPTPAAPIAPESPPAPTVSTPEKQPHNAAHDGNQNTGIMVEATPSPETPRVPKNNLSPEVEKALFQKLAHDELMNSSTLALCVDAKIRLAEAQRLKQNATFWKEVDSGAAAVVGAASGTVLYRYLNHRAKQKVLDQLIIDSGVRGELIGEGIRSQALKKMNLPAVAEKVAADLVVQKYYPQLADQIERQVARTGRSVILGIDAQLIAMQLRQVTESNLFDHAVSSRLREVTEKVARSEERRSIEQGTQFIERYAGKFFSASRSLGYLVTAAGALGGWFLVDSVEGPSVALVSNRISEVLAELEIAEAKARRELEMIQETQKQLGMTGALDEEMAIRLNARNNPEIRAYIQKLLEESEKGK